MKKSSYGDSLKAGEGKRMANEVDDPIETVAAAQLEPGDVVQLPGYGADRGSR
ncbi:hypothetical protein GCM10022237_33560 [Nocardioides ginsengisoli]